MEEGLKEETLWGGVKTRAIDGRCMVVEVTENGGGVGGEVDIQGGVGAKAAMRRRRCRGGRVGVGRSGVRGE